MIKERAQQPIRLTLGISGSTPLNESEAIFARQCGEAIAKNGSYKLLFGACPGTPEELVKSFLAHRRSPRLHKVTGISPWRNGHRHRRGGDPLLEGVEMRYTGIGWNRNGMIPEHSHALIAFGGRWGTLTELGYAAQYKRPILVPYVQQSLPSAVMSFHQVTQIMREVPGSNPVTLLFFETVSQLMHQLTLVRDMVIRGEIPPPRSW